jgi:hypothetical protein
MRSENLVSMCFNADRPFDLPSKALSSLEYIVHNLKRGTNMDLEPRLACDVVAGPESGLA